MAKPNTRKHPTSTMKYLTMIIALAPSIAAFSGVQKRSSLAAGVANSFSSSTLSTKTAVGTRINSSLHYISEKSSSDYAESSVSDAAKPQQGQVWWNSIFNRDQSTAADDYLEFLDRRYNRILHDEKQVEAKGFSVMDWLNGKETPEQRPREEDALYVLGVANLASKKLLQKHHRYDSTKDTSVSPNDELKRRATDVEIVDETAPKAVRSVASVMRQIGYRRQLLLRSQKRQFRLALALLTRTLLTGPVKAVRKLYVMGGGKKNVAVTFAALAALPFVLRPLLRAIVSEGANHLSP